MSERTKMTFKRLFEVRILHHYWLDYGPNLFDLIPDQDRKKQLMAEYDVNTLLHVAPAPSTTTALKRSGSLFIGHRSGFFVISSGKTPIPDDTVFEFTLKVRDANFPCYTALTLPARTIHEIPFEKENRILRYKENVPVWQNTTGATRGTGSEKKLFLSKEYQAIQPGDAVESLIVKEGALWQLTSDQPDAKMQVTVSPVSDLPVFANQADIPAIAAPEGLSGVPDRGIQLTGELPNDIFGLIRLSAKRPSDPDFSFTDNLGQAKPEYPVYQLHFKSRSTFRRYFDRKTSGFISEDTTAMPLTFFGNAGTLQKPDPSRVRIEKTGGKIARIVSDIFVNKDSST
jgi:hypothetical protein